MEYHAINLILIPILLILLPLLFLSLKPNPIPKLPPPPGPKAWPFIDRIHLLGDKPHKFITKLCQIFGPIMSLKLGSITTIVISSPDIAKEMFVKHDLAFSTRHVPNSTSVLNYDKFSMVWLPVCPKWRHLKKIASIQLFTNQRLDASQVLRRKKMDELVDYLKLCCENGQVVDIGKAAFTTSLNLLSNTILSVDLCSYDVSKSGEFKDLFWHVMEEVGRPNVSDFFPLKPLDLQGVRRRSKRYWLKIFGVFEEIIEERLKDLMGNKNDVLDILLRLVEVKELSLDDVKRMRFKTIEDELAKLPEGSSERAKTEIFKRIVGEDKYGYAKTFGMGAKVPRSQRKRCALEEERAKRLKSKDQVVMMQDQLDEAFGQIGELKSLLVKLCNHQGLIIEKENENYEENKEENGVGEFDSEDEELDEDEELEDLTLP